MLARVFHPLFSWSSGGLRLLGLLMLPWSAGRGHATFGSSHVCIAIEGVCIPFI